MGGGEGTERRKTGGRARGQRLVAVRFAGSQARVMGTLRFTCPLVRLTCRITRDYGARALKRATINFTGDRRIRAAESVPNDDETPRTRGDANITGNNRSPGPRWTIRPRKKCVFHYCRNTLRGRVSPRPRDGGDVHDRDTRVTASAYGECVVA